MQELNEASKLEVEEYKINLSVYKQLGVELDLLRKECGQLDLERQSIHVLSPVYVACFFISYLLCFFSGSLDAVSSFIASLIFALYPALFLSDIISGVDSIVNILSLGKFNRIKSSQEPIKVKIHEAEELKKVARGKLLVFEESLCRYHQNILQDFFAANLYRQRSGNPVFEAALSEFSDMVDEVSTLNEAFVTGSVYLRGYRDYLMKRDVDHRNQIAKKSDKVVAIRDFVKDISAVTVAKQPEPVVPQFKYRIARKIENWDEINRKRQLTGRKGEEIVMALEKEFLESINRKDLSDKVRHVASEQGDGLGYDVLSFFHDGKEKYIEVKSTVGSIQSPYYLSRNELAFLQEHQSDAFIYRVFLSDEVPQIRVEMALDVLGKNEFVPTQYLIRAK